MLEEYDIDLSLFKIAQTGNTWYGKYGFQNGLEVEKDKIKAFLQTPYQDSTIQFKAIEYAERLKQGDTSVVDDIKQICKKLEVFLKGLDYSYHRKGRGTLQTKKVRRCCRDAIPTLQTKKVRRSNM